MYMYQQINYRLCGLWSGVDEKNVIIQAVLSLAEFTGTNTTEIDKLRESVASQDLSIEMHPEYEGLLTLRERLRPKLQTEISRKLDKAAYDDIDDIYQVYREKFYDEGIYKVKKTV